MQHDFLKNTWVFQQVLNEGKQEALERQLTRFVEFRLPTLLALAKQTIEQKKSVEQLQMILDKLYQVYTIEEAQAALLTSD